MLPKGNRRHKLLGVARLIFEKDLDGHILPFCGDAASHYADIDADRKSSGRPISQFDAMIAAIVRLHGAKIVTRNTSEFENCGIGMINPWDN